MLNNVSLKEEIMNGDYRAEAENAYVRMVEKKDKKSKIMKIGLGTLYVSLFFVSLFLI